MSYDAFREGTEWCVYKLTNGQPSGNALFRHADRTEAKKYLVSLFAKDATAHAPDTLKQVAYATPQLSFWQRLKSRKKPGIVIHKFNGSRYMFIVTSNSYQDREREYITTDALKNYVERSWIGDDVCKTDNELLFWHEDEHVKAIGDIVWADMQGPFLIEVAKERNTKMAKRIWDYIEAHPEQQWGASHGFRYEEKVLSADGSATYHNIRKFETSVLPRENAANPYTFSGVINMDKRDEVLEKMNIPIGSLRKGVSALQKELEKRGVEHKAATNEAEKGIIDNLSTQVDTFIGKLTDNPPAGLKEEFMTAIVSALAVAPTEEMATEEVPEEMPMDDPMMTEEVIDEEDEEKGMRRNAPRHPRKDYNEQQTKMIEKVVELMATVVQQGNENAEQIKALSEGQKSLAPINELRDEFKKMADRLGSVEKQLAGRPRQASTASETITNSSEVSAEVQKQMQTHSSFWGTSVKGQ